MAQTNKEILITLNTEKMAIAMREIVSRAEGKAGYRCEYDDVEYFLKPSKREHILKEMTEYYIEKFLDSECDEEFWKYRR